jgi:cytochrome c oxidase assembly factor CtaG
MIRKYIYAWFGMMLLAIINGTARDFLYKPFTGDLAAHQISTVILIILFAGYFFWVTMIWPIHSEKEAWLIGIVWFLMTEGFEFGLGLMRGLSWDQLFHAYNLAAGQVWLFIPVWVLIGPLVFFRYWRKKISDR